MRPSPPVRVWATAPSWRAERWSSSDVPPYAIVAGNPAQVIRYRFSRAIVGVCCASYGGIGRTEVVRRHLEWFRKPIDEFVERFDRRRPLRPCTSYRRCLRLAFACRLPSTPATPLVSTGLVEQLPATTVLAAIEATYGVAIDSADIGVDNFDTPAQIIAFIDARR